MELNVNECPIYNFYIGIFRSLLKEFVELVAWTWGFSLGSGEQETDRTELEFLRFSEPGGSKFSQDTCRFKLEPAANRQA